MPRLRSIFHRLRGLFRRRAQEADMAAELRSHLDGLTERNLAEGMSAEEARYAAQRAFGGVAQIAERARDERRFAWLENVGKDLRHGVRVLRRARGFALAAIVSLAIGIGANTAVFSLVYGVLLRPLPYADAAELVTIWSENRRQAANRQTSSYANVTDWRTIARTLEDIAVYDPGSFVINDGNSRRSSGILASANLGTVLGVPPQLGRMFTEEEATRGEAVAVLSYTAWQKHFGGTTAVVGRTLMIDGRTIEIIGVTPKGFYFPDKSTEVWLPLVPPSGSDGAAVRGVGALRAIGRLRPEATLAEAQSEFSTIAASLEKAYPANRDLGVRLERLADQVVGRDLRHALVLLLAAVSAVLLIACSNVGNLMLARGLSRQREFALRLSLGATRARLIAQLLIESLVLCLVAAALGLVLAVVTVDAVRTLAPANIPRLDEIAVDWRMLVFTALVSVGSVCLFGLWPAWHCTRRDALAMLRNSSRDAGETPRSRQWRNFLVVGEFALAVMLFAGAAMLVRSFVKLMAVDPGFRTENVVAAPVRLSASRPVRDAVPFAAALLERVRALPGVTGAALAEEAMLGERNAQLIVAERGTSAETGPMRVPLAIDAVTSSYFHVMEVPLHRGRVFSDFDGLDGPPVAIVNETLARQLWPGEDAVGQRFRIGANAQLAWITVAGVVADQRRQKLDRPPIAQVFLPWAQQPSRGMNVIVRTAVEPASVAALLRAAAQEVDPSAPLGPIMTMRELVDRTVAPQRFHARLLTAFAVIALVLAGVGIFGLMHYAVARRTQEIGVRTALGASPGRIQRDVLGEGLRLATIGVTIGVTAAIALFRSFSALLYETSATDPASLAGAAIVLIAVAMLACFFPARRAARVDPLVSLRSE